MSKGLSILANTRREEHYKSLMEMPDRDMCEMIRAHFESHPTLPGEKVLKDRVNYELSQIDCNERDNQKMIEEHTQKILSEKQALPHEGFVPAANTPFDNDALNDTSIDPAVKEDLARGYAQTRIRETPLKEGNQYLDFRHFDPTALKRERIDELPQQGQADIIIDRVNVELQNNGAGEVYVLAEQSDGSHRTIGSLPENFLKNNPMNVDSCKAELQVVDYSNGNMKNLSTKVVVDTDLMSGDVIDLDEDMFAGLDQETGLEQ